MNIVGVDFSTRYVDLVKLPLEGEGAPKWTRVELQWGTRKQPDAFRAVRTLRHQLGQAALLGGYWNDVAVCFIEDPMSNNMGNAKKLGRVAGAILACIPDRVVVDRIDPAEWRKLVGLPGNATKLEVFRVCSERLPIGAITLWPQDAFDAYCIAIAGRHLCEKGAAA